jgi:hypothetical protein
MQIPNAAADHPELMKLLSADEPLTRGDEVPDAVAVAIDRFVG